MDAFVSKNLYRLPKVRVLSESNEIFRIYSGIDELYTEHVILYENFVEIFFV